MLVVPAQVSRIPEPDHIVGKDNRPHPGQGGAAVLLIRTQPSSGRPTGMSMRTKNTRSFSLPSHRPIEIAINKKAGASLEGCVFHCVPLVGTLLTDNGVKRSTLGQRIQLGSDKDLPANRGRSFLPFLQVGMSRNIRMSWATASASEW